jgi:hypothetical protein
LTYQSQVSKIPIRFQDFSTFGIKSGRTHVEQGLVDVILWVLGATKTCLGMDFTQQPQSYVLSLTIILTFFLFLKF